MERITWDRSGWQLRDSSDDGETIYVNDDGDVALEAWTADAGLPTGLDDTDGLRTRLAELTAESGGGLIEASTLTVAVGDDPDADAGDNTEPDNSEADHGTDGAQRDRAAVQLIKVPDDDETAYIGSVVIPRADGCLTLTFSCQGERTWRRAAAVRDAEIADRGILGVGVFAAHPYGCATDGGLPRDDSDDAAYDDEFADHPLSRCRRHLASATASVRVAAIPEVTRIGLAAPAEWIEAGSEERADDSASDGTGSSEDSEGFNAAAPDDTVDTRETPADTDAGLDALIDTRVDDGIDIDELLSLIGADPLPDPSDRGTVDAPGDTDPDVTDSDDTGDDLDHVDAATRSALDADPDPEIVLPEWSDREQAEPLLFDTDGWDEVDAGVFTDSDDDLVIVSEFALPPDLPRSLDDLEPLQHELAVMSADVGGCLLEMDVTDIDGLPALLRIVKLPNPAGGDDPVYLGSFTIPRADSSLVLRVQCEDHGVNADREAVVFDDFVELYDGDVVAATRDWAGHPYAPELTTGLPATHADDETFDAEFGDHALSRCRRLLDAIAPTIRLGTEFRHRTPFLGPVTLVEAPGAEPSAHGLVWDRAGWQGPIASPHGGEELGFVDDAGDVVVELTSYDPPPLPATLDDSDKLRRKLARLVARNSYRLIEAEPDEIDGLPALWQLVDAPSQGVFVGSYTVPREGAWVLIGYICDKGDDPADALRRCREGMGRVATQLRLPPDFAERPPFTRVGGARLPHPTTILTGDLPADALDPDTTRTQLATSLGSAESPEPEQPGRPRPKPSGGGIRFRRRRRRRATPLGRAIAKVGAIARTPVQADLQTTSPGRGLAEWDRDGWRRLRPGVYVDHDGDTLTEMAGPRPGVPVPLDDVAALRRALVTHAAERGAGVIEVDVVTVDGLPAVRSLVKLSNAAGLAYLGSLVVPRADGAVTLGVLCRDAPRPGREREDIVAARTRRTPGTGRHPYLPDLEGGTPRTDSDDARYDREFPQHALSRCRRALAAVQPSVRLAEAFTAAAPYTGTEQSPVPSVASSRDPDQERTAERPRRTGRTATDGEGVRTGSAGGVAVYVPEVPMSWDRSAWMPYAQGKYIDHNDDIAVETEEPEPALLFAPLEDLAGVRHELALTIARAGGGLVEADPCTVDGLPALRQIYKRRFPGTAGVSYVAGVVVPRAGRSLHLKLQCADTADVGGMREQTAFDRALERSGSDRVTDWMGHPYIERAGGLPRTMADDPEWDELFPQHPLSRCRWLLERLLPTIRLDAEFRELPPWPGPDTD